MKNEEKNEEEEVTKSAVRVDSARQIRRRAIAKNAQRYKMTISEAFPVDQGLASLHVEVFAYGNWNERKNSSAS